MPPVLQRASRLAMTRSITLTFPWFPRELSPNARVHWAERAEATSLYREECGWMAKTQVQPNQDIHTDPPFSAPVLATTTFYVKDKRRRDMNNLDASLKAMWDGIVDAGILADDDYKHLRHAESKLVVEPKGTKRVEVTLEEL